MVCANLSEWISCLLFFLVASRNSSTPLYPKVLQARERTSISCPSIIFILDFHLSLWRSLGAHHFMFHFSCVLMHNTVVLCYFHVSLFLHVSVLLYVSLFHNVSLIFLYVLFYNVILQSIQKKVCFLLISH